MTPLAVCWALLAAPGATPAGSTPAFHLDASSRARIQQSLDRAAAWMLGLQGGDGAFHSGEAGSVPAIPMTALALWALAEAGGPGARDARLRASAEYLLAHQHPDGGVYDRTGGLVRYTAAVVRQGLEAWHLRSPDPALREPLERLASFVTRNRDIESLGGEYGEARMPPASSAKDVERLLDRGDLPGDIRGALDFLRSSAAGDKAVSEGRGKIEPAGTDSSLGYEELLRLICEIARADSPAVSRAHRAIQAHYTVRENPDLTGGRGPRGGRSRDSGLYYYYLTLARTLGAVGQPSLRTDGGREHDWARELSDRLLMLQTREGSWMNENGRWWEGDPLLATSYAMLGLTACRDLKAKEK